MPMSASTEAQPPRSFALQNGVTAAATIFALDIAVTILSKAQPCLHDP